MIIENDNFNLQQIADSGQCFRWKKLDDDLYLIPALGHLLIAKQDGNRIEFSCDENEWDNIWSDYFDCSRNYESIAKKILSGNDNHLKESYLSGSGIRILKQNIWEMIFSFMISQNNSIKRISGSIEKICNFCKVNIIKSKFDKYNFFNFTKYVDIVNNTYAFPSYDEIPLELFDDNSFGLGYRAPYLKEMCEYVSSNPGWLDELINMDYDAAMNSLLLRKGIGKKVANCICLFGLGFTDAFPIDTHVKQFLDKYYSDGIDLSMYEGEAGIIQQYLFFYELVNK